VFAHIYLHFSFYFGEIFFILYKKKEEKYESTITFG